MHTRRGAMRRRAVGRWPLLASHPALFSAAWVSRASSIIAGHTGFRSRVGDVTGDCARMVGLNEQAANGVAT
jgi:hypothetical protein